MVRSVLAVVLAAAFVVPALILPAAAQPQADGEKVERKEAKRREANRRLPAHYGKIVDEAQKDRIYRIQAAYNTKLDPLQAQIEALAAQRDAEIRNVLSAEQQQQLDGLLREAKAARAEKAAKKTAAVKNNGEPPPKGARARKAG
jgi:hypothetical protein